MTVATTSGYILRDSDASTGGVTSNLCGGKWLHFDYVPGESDVRYGSADYTGRLCVIGTQINEAALKELFGL